MADRTLAAAAQVVAAMAIIGLIDQFVRVLAVESSLWTFHVVRAAMIAALAGAWVAWRRPALAVVSWRAVAARSAAVSTGLVVYFGALGFLPVAQAAAGLYTAPLWVLLLSWGLSGRWPGAWAAAAAVAGFAGVALVLAPDPAALGWASLVPVAAGLFYGLGVALTRAWCAREDALVLTLGSFAAIGLWGLGGMAVATLAGDGDTFLTRGWVAPSAAVLSVCLLQAVGSLVAVVLVTRAYLAAEAATVSVLEYTLLGFSALWGLAVWGERLAPTGLAGLALIAGAGAALAWGGRRGAA